MAHAKFGPSKAHRWIPCPGSIALEPEGPSKSSKFADEGSAAHFWGAAALGTGKDMEFYRGAPVQPSIDGETFICDDDFILNVQVYLDDVRARAAGGTLLVEQSLTFSEAIGVPDQFGTGDAVIISGDLTELVVEDLKYGMGVQVFAKDNYQCMLYGVGALEKYEPIIGDTIERVRGVICQPRLDHIDEEVWTRDELRAFAETAALAARKAQEAVAIAELHGTDFLEDNHPELFAPGEKQCRFCPAKATCKALAKVVSADVFDDFEVLVNPDKLITAPAPQIPPTARLAAIYANLDLIEGWARDVRGEVERRVHGGMTIEGPDGLPLKIVEGKKGNRAWKEGAEDQIAGLLAGMGKIGPDKAFKPREIITPSVADKMLGKKGKQSSPEYEQILKPYVIQPDGKAKIALGSDPRPPYEGAASESDFSTVETGD
jgi:hypothetical protein